VRRSRISGFVRARLALVGETKDGRRLLVERLVASPDDNGADASDPLNATLEVGEVFRRFGAEVSMVVF
jgi:hypothetical protein